MLAKVLLTLVAVLAYGAMLWSDLTHPEAILSRRGKRTIDAESPARPAAHDETEMALVDLAPFPSQPYSEPTRDVFGYKQPPRPRPVPAAAAAPPPPPPVVIKPKEKRIRRESITVHGVRIKTDPPDTMVFLSVNDQLLVLREGDALPGDLQLTEVTTRTIAIETLDRDEAEVFELP